MHMLWYFHVIMFLSWLIYYQNYVSESIIVNNYDSISIRKRKNEP